MEREYELTEIQQKDLVKTTDECVELVFKKGRSFITRNKIPQASWASVPMSVAFTILNSLILRCDSIESVEFLKEMIMGNIEQMFRNVSSNQSKTH